MASEPVISTLGVKRSFGKVRALDGFDVSIPAGKITALVGPNGAGKTTLLLILAGLLAANEGNVRVAGANPVVEPFEVHARVGWMPDFFGVYDGLTSAEYLELFGAAHRIAPPLRAERARDLLNTVDLAKFADQPVHALSRGQKQRLGLARALVHRPSLLLLDEPASGLDPRARVELRELLTRQRAEGVSVVVSSHILSELEEMADLVVFVDAGRCRGVFPIGELPQTTQFLTWRLRALDAGSLVNFLSERSMEFRSLPDATIEIQLTGEDAAAELISEIVRSGIQITEAARQRGTLERAFLNFETESI